LFGLRLINQIRLALIPQALPVAATDDVMTDTRNSIVAFYINGGVRELIPIYPLYAIMFGEHGVTAFELAILFSGWAAVGIVMEVPSGALADRFSRKWLIVASGVLKSLAFLTWFTNQHFYGYLMGFMFWGLGSTLRSGAWEALLYDLLARADEKHRFTHHYGRIRALATSGVVIGELMGGLLITRGFDIVLLVSAAVPLLATIPFIILVSDVTKNSEQSPSYTKILLQGVTETVSNIKVLYILLVTTFLLTTFGVYDEFVTPVLFETGFSLALVAYIAAPLYVAQALGEAMAGRFTELTIGQISALMVIASGCLLVTVAISSPWVPLAIAGYFFLFGLAGTLFSGLLQRSIEGTSRATITSTVGLGDGAGAIIWFLVFGKLAESESMTQASGLYAVIIAALVAGFYILARRWAVTTEHPC
jgi:hypothetical protein